MNKNLLFNKFKLFHIIKLYSRRCLSQCDEKKKPIMTPNCKSAFVFGGSEGIGLAITHQFMTEKLRHVALAGIDMCKGKEAVNVLNCTYGDKKAIFLHSNVHCTEEIAAALKVAEQDFGKIEIYVNSVGIVDDFNWETEIATNFTGIVRSTLHAYSLLSKENGGKGGCIINIAGTHGLEPLSPAPILSGTLHAVIGFSRSLGSATNYERSGVRVITLCPGVTQTNFINEIKKKALTNIMGEELHRELCEKSKIQKSEVCAKAALHLLQFAPSGSVWSVEGSKLYLLPMPHWKRNAILISQYL